MFLNTVKKGFNLKIQLFAEEPGDTGGSGGGDTGNPQSPAIEVPEYIKSYAEGIENPEQKEYITGLLSDEKAVNLLKGFIPDPNKEWDIKVEDYKDMPDDVEAFINGAKEQGISETIVKSQLEARKAYLSREREAMTPELRQFDATINNFITAEKDVAKAGVYARLAENATGRQVLIELMTLKTGGAGASAGNSNPTGGGFNLTEWKEKYNDAIDRQDEEAKKRLKAEAMSSGEKYKEYFNVFFRQS